MQALHTSLLSGFGFSPNDAENFAKPDKGEMSKQKKAGSNTGLLQAIITALLISFSVLQALVVFARSAFSVPQFAVAGRQFVYRARLV